MQAYGERGYAVVATSRGINPVPARDVVTVQGDLAGHARPAASAAPFVTGEILHVDGGQSAGH